MLKARRLKPRLFLRCLRVAHDAADYWSARVTEPHIVVVLVPMIRSTAFAGRYKNKLKSHLPQNVPSITRVAAGAFGYSIRTACGRKGTMKSPVISRTIYIDGRKTGVSLEDAFWSGLKEIADAQGTTVSVMVAEIDKKRGRSNLSSAVRLFVLDRVRSQKVGATAGKRQPQ